jgi:hypothetical protein
MPKLKRILYCSGPSLLFVLLYWHGLFSWFQMDDFAWLGLRRRVFDFDSFVTATFTPYAQGTIRPFSERLFFMGMFSAFGLNAFPYHAVVFVTQIFNLIMLARLMRRLTGSNLASFATPALWVVNSNIHLPVSWASAFNQILCSTVLLGATYLFVRFTETGRRRYYASQWIVFLLGFGVLELVVVYPAIAALYAMLRAREYVKYTLPMFAASGLYTLLHRSVQPAQKTSTYAMHFDASISKTLATYCYWAVGPHGQGAGYYFLAAAIGIGIAAFIAARLRRHDWLPLFFCGWFAITIAPYLPLRDHMTEYYLTIPAIGLAMIGGYALAFAKTSHASVRVLTVTLVLAYALPSAWAGQRWTREFARVSHRVQNFVERLASAHKRNPGKALLLAGVDSELFWAGVYDRPFRIFGLNEVFLTQETESRIDPFPDRVITSYFLADSVAYEGIRTGQIAVYENSDARMRNVTSFHEAVLSAKRDRSPPRMIDAGAIMYGVHLVEGWHNAESGHRWTAKRAVVNIGAPISAGAMLKVSGYSPNARFNDGPVMLTVTIEDRVYPPVKVDASTSQFSFVFPLPAGAETKRALKVTLEVDRTMQVPGDPRELGLVFGRFEIVTSD